MERESLAYTPDELYEPAGDGSVDQALPRPDLHLVLGIEVDPVDNPVAEAYRVLAPQVTNRDQAPLNRRAQQPSSRELGKMTRYEEDDLIRQYLSEINHPILTREEEVALSKRVMAMLEAKRKLASESRLKPREVRDLEAVISDGEAARDEFVRCNLRLVATIAKRYTGAGLEYLDLVQEGNIKLQHAVEKFDWRKGFKFSTYATRWVRQAMKRAIATTSRTIDLSEKDDELLQQMSKIEEQAQKEQLSRLATDERLMEYMGLTPKELAKIKRMKFITQVDSLDEKIGLDAEVEVVNFVTDPESDYPLDRLMNLAELRSIVEKTDMNDREKYLLVKRFGLDDSEPVTLQAIGDKFGKTREQIRQMEIKLLAKLRSAGNLDNLAKRCNLNAEELKNFTKFFTASAGHEQKKRPVNAKVVKVSATEVIYRQVTDILHFNFGQERIRQVIDQTCPKTQLGTKGEVPIRNLMYERFGITPSEDPKRLQARVSRSQVLRRYESRVVTGLLDLPKQA